VKKISNAFLIKIIVLQILFFAVGFAGKVNAAAITVESIPRGSEKNSSNLYIKYVSQNTVDSAISTGKWVKRTEYIRTSGDVEIEDGQSVDFRSPIIRLKPGFHAKSGSNFTAGIPTFKVHFVNMVDPSGQQGAGTGSPSIGGSGFETTGAMHNQDDFDEFCQGIIDTLNQNFVNEPGGQIIKFEFKDALMWDTSFDGTDYEVCVNDLAGIGWRSSTGLLEPSCSPTDIFNSSQGDFFRDDDVINIVLFDNYINTGHTSGGTYNIGATVEGFMNIRRHVPLVQLDYHRLRNNPDTGLPGNAAVEEHELGHVFGVHHVRTNGAPAGPTNVMSSGSTSGTWNPENSDTTCKDLQGDRSTGFLLDSFADINPGSTTNVCYRVPTSDYIGFDTNDSEQHSQSEIIMSTAEYFYTYLD